jgi:hypothetical protein
MIMVNTEAMAGSVAGHIVRLAAPIEGGKKRHESSDLEDGCVEVVIAGRLVLLPSFLVSGG